MIFETNTPEETIAIGKKIGEKLTSGAIIAMEGTLAAGETTITKGIALGLGIEEEITSPTFTLISEYEGRIPLYHMDVYRIDTVEDFLGLGVEEMLYGNGVCVIEWSEKIRSELPKETITIIMKAGNKETRQIEINNWPYGDI